MVLISGLLLFGFAREAGEGFYRAIRQVERVNSPEKAALSEQEFPVF